MPLEPDQMAWDAFLIILEGIVIAIVLKKWEEYVEQKKEKKKIHWLMRNFNLFFTQQKSKDLYYFIKLLPPEEQKLIQYVLLMEMSITNQTDSSGKRDIILLENNQFAFRLDPKWESQIKIQGKSEIYSFVKSNENSHIYQSFRDFVQQQCKIHQIPI